ncbi:MAG: glutaredoxin family protein [Dehalococcoidia bacterium]|nr:glutaredoxin family protein [Dehalococcoidia bacterium]
MTVVHVPGKESGHIMLYALSTCGWCRKTRELLEELGVAYDYEYVDLLRGADRERAVREISVWNPGVSFPTLVLDEKKSIIGFKENDIREAVGK